MAGKRFVVIFKFTGSNKVYYLNNGCISFCDDIYEAKFMTDVTAHDTVHQLSDDTKPDWVAYMAKDGLSIREGCKAYKRMTVSAHNLVHGFEVKRVDFTHG
jgi:hypothetical protein